MAAPGYALQPTVLAHAPVQLTRQRLRRLGEGIGKVVYASDDWVVKRERSPSEIVSLIVLWKLIRKCERLLPTGFSRRLLAHPSRQIRVLRLGVQALMKVLPRSVWMTTHLKEVWRTYRIRDRQGEKLARQHLEGTPLIPERIQFPPTRVAVNGWPGYLTVCEATERMECTLHQRITELARAGREDEIEQWLSRFLELRRQGWSRGLFSTDAHLKNFGVHGERIVLLDSGGLTVDWAQIERRLAFEEGVEEPHGELGLASALATYPALAARFNQRWKAVVNRAEVQRVWPSPAKASAAVAGQ